VGVVGVVQQQEQSLQHDCRAGSTRAWIVATPEHGTRYDVTCVGDDVAEQHGSKGPLLSLNRHRIVRIRQPSHPPSPQPSSYGDDQQIHGTPTGMLLTKGSPPTVLPRREDEASGDTRRAPADRCTTQGSLPLPRIHLVIRSQGVDVRSIWGLALPCRRQRVLFSRHREERHTLIRLALGPLRSSSTSATGIGSGCCARTGSRWSTLSRSKPRTEPAARKTSSIPSGRAATQPKRSGEQENNHAWFGGLGHVAP
jgi:hypothetical protein